MVGESIIQNEIASVPMFQLCVDDGLPAQVCSQCVQQINTSYNFKLQCETSDVTLRKLLVHHQSSSDTQVNII